LHSQIHFILNCITFFIYLFIFPDYFIIFRVPGRQNRSLRQSARDVFALIMRQLQMQKIFVQLTWAIEGKDEELAERKRKLQVRSECIS